MLAANLETLLREAKEGGVEQRNRFIASHQSFILSIIRSFVKHSVDKSHDLYGEALVAFNEAIDRYDMSLNTSFYGFSSKHVRYRLLDYLKKENKHRHLPYEIEDEEGSLYSPFEMDKVRDEYSLQQENERRSHAFQIFIAKLRDYQIEPQVLATHSPKHTDTKKMLLRIIEATSENDELVSYMKKKKKLPIKKISKLCLIPKKSIDNHRRYIIAHLLIITEQDLFPLRHFLDNS